MKSEIVGIQRLVNQRIAGAKCDTPAAVVKWMGAMQVLWAIGLRMGLATEAAKARARASKRCAR